MSTSGKKSTFCGHGIMAPKLWDALFLFAVVRSVLPDLINTHDQRRHFDQVTDALTAGRAPLASAVGLALDVALVGVALLRLIHLASPGAQRPPAPVLWLGATTLVAYGSFMFSTDRVTRAMVVYALVIVALTWEAPPWERVSTRFVAWGAFLMAASWAAAVAIPDTAWARTNEIDRVTLIEGARLSGIFTHPNMLAYFSLAVISIVVTNRNIPFRRILLLLSIATTFASGSRTSLLTSLAVILFWAMRGMIGPKLRAIGVTALLAAIVLPAIRPVSVDVAGRDVIWNRAREAWPQSPLFGHGLYFWQEGKAQFAGFPGYAFHAHNQLLDTLVLSGLPATIMLIMLLSGHVAQFVRWSPTSPLAFPALSLALLVQTVTEVPVQFLLIDPRTIVLVVATLSIVPNRKFKDAIGDHHPGAKRGTPHRGHGLQRRVASRT